METNYPINFLESVIFRVDFPTVLELVNNAPAEFQNKIREQFPKLKEDIVFIEAKIDISKRDIGDIKSGKERKWEFYNDEDKKKVIITPFFVALEYNRYSNFEVFYKDLELIFKNFFEIYPSTIATRIGLRYQNIIKFNKGNPFDWEKFINPNLYNVTKYFLNEKCNPIRSLHIIELKEDKYNMNFKFGLFNSEYPNDIFKKEYLLDYDCYIREDTDIPKIYEKVKEFHSIIKEWFDKNTLEGLKKVMKGETDEI
jgi:uncharacterized protein (TIGR04255 family)